ncbi:MFS-type transporter SLC18B1-like [Hyalella azteca]|uniref:MFS-type transporter SLC18B1-like n=2 Tax=Hyalella azteca TaxID=294128 RepID=A0A8B7NG78_HYAAZ|nr:MFS-type transporter SLC18B1-like [Hyalella azteca]
MRNYTRKQWLTLIVFCIAHFCNAMCMSIQAPFYPHEAEKKGATTMQYSFVFAVFELVVFIVCPIYGQFLERIGVNFMNNAGIFTVSVSCILFGFLNRMSGPTVFLTFSFIIRIMEALGNAAFLTTAFSIIAQEFSLNVASAFATLETFYGLGMIAGPSVGGALYELGGFTLPFVVLGSLLMVAAAMVWYFLPVESSRTRPTSRYTVFLLMRKPKIFLFAFTTMSGSMSIFFLFATLEPHIRPWNLAPLEIGLIFVLDGFAYAVSAPIWGRLCDRCLPERAATTMGALTVTVAFLLLGPSPILPIKNSLPLCICALVIHGIGFGAEMVATFSGAKKDAVEAGLPDDLATYGLVSGLWNSSVALGGFIGPSIAGVMFDTIGFGWGTFIIALLHLFVAIVTISLSCYYRYYPDQDFSERSTLFQQSARSESTDSTYDSGCNSTRVSREDTAIGTVD